MTLSHTETVYGELRDQILRCELMPGQRVTERLLVESTGFGKTPVREALGRLASDGLVQAQPRSGYIVTPITLSDIDEIFEASAVIISSVMRLAAQRDPESLVAGLNRAHDELTHDYDVSAQRVNLAIAEATGNSRLVDVCRRLFDQQRRVFALAFRVAGPAEWLTEGFEQIAQAVADGNIDGAVAGMEKIEALAREESIKVLSSLTSIRSTAISV